jgi:hypothetical protein
MRHLANWSTSADLAERVAGAVLVIEAVKEVEATISYRHPTIGTPQNPRCSSVKPSRSITALAIPSICPESERLQNFEGRPHQT